MDVLKVPAGWRASFLLIEISAGRNRLRHDSDGGMLAVDVDPQLISGCKRAHSHPLCSSLHLKALSLFTDPLVGDDRGEAGEAVRAWPGGAG